MMKEIVTAMVLCAGILAGITDAGSAEGGAEYNVNIVKAKEEAVIPEYIVTQQPFSSFSGLFPGESQTQVFSVLNTDAVIHTYYLKVAASSGMIMEMTKAGDFFAKGEVTEDTMELVTLAPGENKVFSLTLTEPEDGEGSAEAEFYFTKKAAES